MGIKDIPKGMTATQVNVLVGVRDGGVYRRKADGTEKDFMEANGGLPQGVVRQVTWLLEKGFIRKGPERSGRAYYVLTDAGRVIAQGL